MFSRLSDIINGISFLFVYLLAHIELDHKYLIYVLIIAVNLVLGLRIYFLRKKEIKNIKGLIRTGISFKTFAPLIFSFVCFVSAEYFVDYYFQLNESDYLTLLLIPLFGTTILSNSYQSFIFSLRIFNDGIKLPGAQSKLKLWKDVKEISRKNSLVTIKFHEKTKSFLILKKDLENIDNLILLFRKKQFD